MNARALELRARGDLPGATAALHAAVERFPDDPALRTNLGFVLAEGGDLDAAERAYAAALRSGADPLEAHVARGLLLFRLARNDEAEAALGEALRRDPLEPRANLAMYDLRHVQGDPRGAVAYLRRALERRTLFSSYALEERRSVLVLCAPGDLQANIPVDFLFDPRTTTFHKLYLVDEAKLAAVVLPRYDVVLNAIAESPEAGPALALAERFAAAQRRPFLNRPGRVLLTARERLVEALRAVDCRLAPIVRTTRAALAAGSPLPYPIIARPVGSQAGHGLAKLDDDAALREYLAGGDDEAFYVSAFVDYRGADGFYRKYRVICVDGEPYPCHLAISPRWMIHYYNAPMAEHAWMRAEEERFLAGLENAFAPPLRAALRGIAAALGLEYVGIDCTIDRDGRLFVFESDPAMVVHASDPVDLYPYKARYVPRIFRAVEAMLDARKAVP